MTEHKQSEVAALLSRLARGIATLGFAKPQVLDSGPKTQSPIVAAYFMGEIHGIVRSYKHGSLGRHPYSSVGALIGEVVAKVARDAWLQGKEAHADCENPYKEQVIKAG